MFISIDLLVYCTDKVKSRPKDLGLMWWGDERSSIESPIKWQPIEKLVKKSFIGVRMPISLGVSYLIELNISKFTTKLRNTHWFDA
jgi:hypothetical protein